MVDYSRPFWRSTVFVVVIRGTLAFFVLTIIAMFFYPGGTLYNPNTVGYSFFGNFFSDLGLLVTMSGASNLAAAALFFVGTSIVGSMLVLFFLAFPRFFRENKSLKTLSIIGSIWGVLSGLCFVGVAFVPRDVSLHVHRDFALWAFRFFPAAVLFYVIAIFKHPNYARQYGWALVGFFVLLVANVMLMKYGPPPGQTYMGTVIQATAQKIIVYASIISVTFQAWGARKFQGSDRGAHAAKL
jgi:hypothetical protein